MINYVALKNVLDRVFAVLLLLTLLPLLIALCCYVAVVLKGTPIFVQERIGYKERTFKLLKFKTMRGTVGAQLRKDGDRVFPALSFLRRTALDELPQLVNILKGEMSFVGPRPLLKEYLEFYTLRQRKRHLVKPGLTGLAQVKGANALSWRKRLLYDTIYVKLFSGRLDLIIVGLTLKQIINPHREELFSEPLGVKEE